MGDTSLLSLLTYVGPTIQVSSIYVDYAERSFIDLNACIEAAISFARLEVSANGVKKFPALRKSEFRLNFTLLRTPSTQGKSL